MYILEEKIRVVDAIFDARRKSKTRHNRECEKYQLKIWIKKCNNA